MSRPASTLLVVLLVISSVGCEGADDGNGSPPSASAEALLDAAFAEPIRTAQTRSDLHLELRGTSPFADDLTVELEGPYVRGGAAFPRFDWTGNASVLGFEIDLELVSMGDNLLVGLYGEGYEVGKEEFAELVARLSEVSLPARELFGPARYDGRGEVDGVETEHVSADLERKRVSEKLRPLRELLGLEHLPTPVGRIGAWIGVDDRVLRKLAIDAAFGVAPDDRARLGGVSGGTLKAEIVLASVNEPRTLPERPRGVYKPISDLVLTLSDLRAFAD